LLNTSTLGFPERELQLQKPTLAIRPSSSRLLRFFGKFIGFKFLGK